MMHPNEHDTDAPFLVELAGDDEGMEACTELERLHSSARTRQRWLLGIVVLVGIGSIWSMRQYGGGPATATASTGQDVVAQYLQRDTDQATSSTPGEEHLNVLHRSYTEQQIPVDDLDANPFLVHHGAGGNDAASLEPGAAAESRRNRRLAELETLVRTMHVQSTMTGRTPLASINGQVLRTGETVEGGPDDVTVILRHVEGNSVQLEATDTAMELSGTWTVYIGR
jgi:hypothetical protein